MNDEFDPRAAIEEINVTLKQPNEFAKVFCHAASIDKSIDLILKHIIRDLINKDIDTREYLKILKEVQTEDWKSFLKTFGFGLWNLFYLLFGALVTYIFSK